MPEAAAATRSGVRSPLERLLHADVSSRQILSLSQFGMMRDFSEGMERMFRGTEPSFEGWAPAVDVERSNRDFVIIAELPGLSKSDVTVEVAENTLFIEGERKHEQKEDHEGYRRYERQLWEVLPGHSAARNCQRRACESGIERRRSEDLRAGCRVQKSGRSPSSKPARKRPSRRS